MANLPVLNITNVKPGIYEFTANQTHYTMFDRGDCFEVWTTRVNMRRHAPGIKLLTLAEMANGKNKTLTAFAQIIRA